MTSRFACAALLLLCLAVPARAQQPRVSGTVRSKETGKALAGASVTVEGTPVSTMTDADGHYVLNVPSASGTLRFELLGFGTQRVDLTGQAVVNVLLVPTALEIEGVVVVGYGTQRKENLTGAVGEVSAAQLADRPITSVGQGLEGASPNLNIIFDSGQPGAKADYNIRGVTSINGGSPLVLIDGVPGDPDLINPQDIEQISVLKDAASAAIYGARGAFGVILITTKRATRQKPRVTYSSNVAWSRPTIVPEAVTDPYVAMTLYNDAYNGYAGTDVYTQADLDYARQRSQDPSLPAVVVQETSAGKQYKYFGSTDWFHELYNYDHPMAQQDVSVSGRTNDLSYYLSGGLLGQQGTFNYNSDSYRRYNVRAKLELNVTPWLTLKNNAVYNRGDYKYPTLWGGTVDIWRYLAVTASAQIPAVNPDGTWTSTGSYLAFYRDGGRGLTKDHVLQNTFGARTSFLGDRWHIAGDVTYQADGYNRNDQYLPVPFSSTPGVITNRGINRIVAGNSDNSYTTINLYTDFGQQLGRHTFKALVGYNQELRSFRGDSATADDAIGGLGSLNMAVGNETTTGWASEWALRGVFYRLNYDFAGRYLLELNGRYDGTSRFRAGDRFGFFPSASAGWRVSDERFFQGLKPGVTDLKLRASYGTLGNQQVATYAYIPTMPTSISSVIINGQRPVVVGPPGLVSPSLTWEKATTLDFGVDASFLANRLSTTFDWYRRATTDMLTKGRTLPAVLGANEPNENAADLRTTGWELSVKWDADAGRLLGRKLSYGLGAGLSDYQSVITRFDNPNRYLGDYYVGQKLGEIWGYETEGFFQSEEEIASHADQTPVERFPDRQGVGDLEFRDRNGDGVISPGENTVDNPGDRYVIGNTTPRYNYSFTARLDWSNFGVSAFFQGVGKRDYYPGAEMAYFWSVYNRPYSTPLAHLVDNYWTPEHTDAYFPRLKGYIALVNGKDLAAPQTRYLQDASYLRLKNVTVRYTLPKQLVSRVGVDRLQLYVSGENLWERTHLRIPIDPELLLVPHSLGDGQKYPFQRSYSAGLNLTF
ncbi:MAG TPA: TonB-dependent receptor [Longimicrobiales bacterium]|nr:TonB-dependent receptor [Longimicrobiales bacterium]